MKTRGLHRVLGFGLLLVTVACAEGTPSARSANDEDESTEGGGAKKRHDDPDWYDSGSATEKTTDKDKAPAKKKLAKVGDGSGAEPVFKDGMSVNDAINAIPQGLPRVNIDQEDLDRPLMDPEFYKSCKLSAAQHFTIKFAIWDGRAVGIDITTQPANKGMEKCLHGVIAAYTWKDKVRSLNISTVTF